MFVCLFKEKEIETKPLKATTQSLIAVNIFSYIYLALLLLRRGELIRNKGYISTIRDNVHTFVSKFGSKLSKKT